jgi:hypothetical protein
MVVRRHLAGMSGMALLGVTTSGIGAIISWAYTMYGMVESSLASKNRENRLQSLCRSFKH